MTSTETLYNSPHTTFAFVTRKRELAFQTGLAGLAVGAACYGTMCAIVLVAYVLDARGLPTPGERGLISAAAMCQVALSALWIRRRQNIYQFRASWIWFMAIGGWLLIPLSLAILIMVLGI